MSEQSDIIAAINDAEHILLSTHVGPDGDALGSLTAAGLALQRLGKQVTMAVDGGMIHRYSYLPLADQVRTGAASNLRRFDLMIALDCGDRSRLGDTYTNLPHKPPLINIDHHATNDRFGDLNLVRADAVATVEILFDLFKQMDVTIDVDIATALLTGLVTDTLNFRTPNVTPRTLMLAGELMEAGADLPYIVMVALNLKSFSALKMWRAGLYNMQLEDGLIWATISRYERAQSGYDGASNAGLVGLLSNVQDAKMALVLLELDDGRVSVGLRSRPPYDVAVVAVAYGGGGHQQAAGCTMEGPLAKAEIMLVDSCQAAIREQEMQLESQPQ